MVLMGQRTKGGDRTRTAILEAAMGLLGRVGPDAFSASALAREAGVSKATVFHHFSSMDEVPLAAFEQYWLRTLAPDVGERISARGYLEGLGRQVVALAREHNGPLRAHVVFLTKAIFDSRLRQRLASGAIEMHQAMVRELSTRLPKGRSAPEIEAMARMVEMALDGLMIAVVVRRRPKDLTESKQAWARFVDLLLGRTGSI